MEFSDRDLVSEIRSGSEVAFERLMRRYERLVYRIAFAFTEDAASAMDVTQETFLKVYERLGSWRGEGELRNWIARIAANEGRNWVRARRRRPVVALEEDVFLEPAPAREDPPAAHAALRRSLRTLHPRQQLALVLRYFEGMSAREISRTLDCSEGTARNILFRGLRKLRATMAECREVER